MDVVVPFLLRQHHLDLLVAVHGRWQPRSRTTGPENRDAVCCHCQPMPGRTATMWCWMLLDELSALDFARGLAPGSLARWIPEWYPVAGSHPALAGHQGWSL